MDIFLNKRRDYERHFAELKKQGVSGAGTPSA
jgi:hypothetical protein